MSELLAKLLASLALFLACGIPSWVYLLARWAFEPEGFWQDLVLFGVGAYFLGGIQIFLGIAFIVLLAKLWLDS